MVSLPDLWQNLLTTSKSDEIFSLETADGSFVSYRVDSFLSRTRKVATAFREKLKVVPGSRVALLIDDPAEFAPVAHAMWFLRAVVVHLSSSYSDQQLVEVIDNTSTQIVVFSLPLAARIAKITPKASGVREWVVSGSAAANQESSMSTVEGLISGISESDEMLDSVIGSDLALVSFTRGSRGPRFGVGFSQEQLVANIVRGKQYLQRKKGAVWNLVSLNSYFGMMHSFLIPFFAGRRSIVNSNIDLNDFWELIKLEKIQSVVLDSSQLGSIVSNKKIAKDAKASSLTEVYLYPSGAPADHLSLFFEETGIPIYLMYGSTELGGVVTCASDQQYALSDTSTNAKLSYSKSGFPLTGVEVVVRNEKRGLIDEEEVGDVLVRAAGLMVSYMATEPGAAKYTDDGYLSTGDLGYFLVESDGRRQFVIVGRKEEILRRGDKFINISTIAEIVQSLPGILIARSVAFKNVYTAFEIGLYVLIEASSKITKSDVMLHLSDRVDHELLPKVLILTKADESSNVETTNDVERLFDKYENVRF